jgi:pyridoxine 5'-phosphate synthase PdxJ
MAAAMAIDRSSMSAFPNNGSSSRSPDPAIVERVAEVGADGIEIYTGKYASEERSGSAANQLDLCAELEGVRRSAV